MINTFSARWPLGHRCASGGDCDAHTHWNTTPEGGASPGTGDPVPHRAVQALASGGSAAESEVTPERAMTEDPVTRHAGDFARARRPGGDTRVLSQTYEITFLGKAGTTLRAEFEDCEVTIGPGTTTLRAELPDRGALSGLMERINSLGLDVIDVSLVAPPA